MKKLPRLLFTLFLSVLSPLAWAQNAAPNSNEDIEALFIQEENKQTQIPQQSGEEAKTEKFDAQMRELKDLAILSPFADVAVIQRRFLPKTGRFEFFGGPTTILNDVFFLNYGVHGRFGYYFREKYGMELMGLFLSKDERAVTGNLRTRGVRTTSLVTPHTYYGGAFKWIPIYGKMSWINKEIVPFDLYFTLGGITGTSQSGGSGTLHVGTGQTFAVSKSFAWRWDFTWNFYSSKSSVEGSSATAVYNNLFITAGASFFFPEATYR